MDPYTKVLDIKYHQQDAEGFCGAACAQMVLHTKPFKRKLISQDTLDGDIQASGDQVEARFWFAEPGGLKQTLNDNRTNNNTGDDTGWKFNLLEFDDEPSVTQRIIWNIQSLSVPAIALVNGFGHWLVVCGFATETEPTSESGFVIKGLFVHDPYPAVPSEEGLPPPHAEKPVSDGCGIGGKRGTSRHYITYDEWRSKGNANGKGYMTGVPEELDSHWSGRFLAISAEPIL